MIAGPGYVSLFSTFFLHCNRYLVENSNSLTFESKMNDSLHSRIKSEPQQFMCPISFDFLLKKSF